MEVFSGAAQSQRGPAAWFTGTVWIDPVASPQSTTAMRAARVTFEPGARTAWHTHPRGQAIHVLSGVCLAQSRGGPLHKLCAGDTAWFAPDEVHWHGATRGNTMVHLAMQQPDDSGSVVTWMEHVSDDEAAGPREKT